MEWVHRAVPRLARVDRARVVARRTPAPHPPPMSVDRARFSIVICAPSRIHRLESSRRGVAFALSSSARLNHPSSTSTNTFSSIQRSTNVSNDRDHAQRIDKSSCALRLWQLWASGARDLEDVENVTTRHGEPSALLARGLTAGSCRRGGTQRDERVLLGIPTRHFARVRRVTSACVPVRRRASRATRRVQARGMAFETCGRENRWLHRRPRVRVRRGLARLGRHSCAGGDRRRAAATG